MGSPITFSFVHPGLALAAALTAAIPFLIHFLNRRRYRKVDWAAMSFLLAANRRSARRLRFEQFFMLLLRALVIVLAGLAIARPFFPAQAIPGLTAQRTHRIVLLDNSLSMSATTSPGETRFSDARKVAEELVRGFPAQDAISLVTMAEPVDAPLAAPAFDRRLVLEKLARVEPTQLEGNANAALARAREIVDASESPVGSQTVYIISDFPTSEWAPDSGASAAIASARTLSDRLGAAESSLVVISAASAGRNIAIKSMESESPFLARNVPVGIVVEIASFADQSVRGAALEILRNGAVIHREALATLTFGEVRSLRFVTEFSDPGIHVLEARLVLQEPDSLAADNARYVSLEVRDSLRVLLMDGRPGARLLDGESGYLATALSPRLGDDPEISGRTSALFAPRIISESDLDQESLTDYAVIALCNVQRLSPGQWATLEQFIERGGGLMVFAGDQVNLENYNQYGYADHSGVLPIRFARENSRSQAGAAPEADSKLGFMLSEAPHPAMADFARFPGSGLFLARVGRYLPFEAADAAFDVLLRFTDGAPAIVASSHGSGRVLLCAFSADMDWTNLPAKGDYVSLMHTLTSFVAPPLGRRRNLLVGDSMQEAVSAAQASFDLRLTDPAGASLEPSRVPDGSAMRAVHGPLTKMGVWTFSVGSQTRKIAVNPAPSESDLLAMDEPALRAAMGRPFLFVAAEGAATPELSAPRVTEVGQTLFYLVLGLLFAESFIALYLGRENR